MTEINEESILNVLSTDWQNITHLIFKLKIKNMRDARYLQNKLINLVRKGKIITTVIKSKKHWKLNEEFVEALDDQMEKVYQLEKGEDYSSAIKLLKKILQNNQHNQEVIAELGYLYYQVKDYQNSFKYYELLVKQNPQEPSYLHNLGATALFLEKFELSKDYILQSLEIDKNNSLAWYHLSKVNYSQNQYSKALEAIDTCLELDPTNKDAEEFRLSIMDKIIEPVQTRPIIDIFSDVSLNIGEDQLEITTFIELNDFEKKIREFLQLNLQKTYGENWWDPAIPESIRETVVHKIIIEKIDEPDRNFDKIEFLDVNDYFLIISYKPNWNNIFSQMFYEKKYALQTHFEAISRIRNRTMHLREITKKDLIKLRVAISEILKFISN